jgi:hypothetical protein
LPLDAAAAVVDRVLSAWKEDNIPAVLPIDIKVAFPSIARGRLMHAMKTMLIDGDLI